VEKLRFRSWIAGDWWIAPTSDGDSAANEEMKAKQKRKTRELRFRDDVIPINLLISTNLGAVDTTAGEEGQVRRRCFVEGNDLPGRLYSNISGLLIVSGSQTG
jgi:hypothetical protein